MPASEMLEQVLVSCQSADPFSTLVVSPQTGGAVWSYKGSELQGALTNLAVPVGLNGDYLAVTTKDKPMVHFVAAHIRDRTHQKSVLPGIARAFAVHPTGTVVCCAIEEKIYTWMLTTGQLLTIVNAHYQPISKLEFASDGSVLVSAGDDGVVQVWLLVDLMTPHDAGLAKPEPLRKWSPHSLPITGLFVTSGGADCRVLTCSADQTACLHSTSSGDCLLTVIADCKLTSCAVDSAESRIFLGTAKGVIAQINLYMEPVLRERHLTTIGDNDEMPLFKNHKATVTCLDTNLDGTLFVSGDEAGQYCIWDIASRQCLKSSSMKEAISTARFIPNWLSLGEADHKKSPLPVAVLQKQLAKNLDRCVPVALRPAKAMDEMNSKLDELIANRLQGERSVTTRTEYNRADEKVSKRAKGDIEIVEEEGEEDIPDTVEALKAELKKALRTNRQLYAFAANRLVDQI